MTYPAFNSGDVLTATDMNAVGLWKVVPTSVTNGTVAADGDVTVGSAVGSVTVNGAFSATYDNYRIIYAGGTSSATASLNLSLGAATTNYYNSTVFTVYATAAVSATTNNNGSSFVYAGATNSTDGPFLTIDLFNPYLSKSTGYGGSFIVTDVAGHTGGIQRSNTSFTSFTVTPGTGTLTGGIIRVYGYN